MCINIDESIVSDLEKAANVEENLDVPTQKIENSQSMG